MCNGKNLKPFLDKFSFGAETLVHAFRNGSVSSENLVKAFLTAGQHVQAPIDVPECFGFPNNKSTVDYKKIIGQCTTQVLDTGIQNFERAVPALIGEYGRLGRNESTTMDFYDIPKNEIYNDRTDKVSSTTSMNPFFFISKSHTILRLPASSSIVANYTNARCYTWTLLRISEWPRSIGYC